MIGSMKPEVSFVSVKNEYEELELRPFEEKQSQLESHKFDPGVRQILTFII